MLNRSASLAMSTSAREALPGKLDIERRSPSILYLLPSVTMSCGLVTKTLELCNKETTFL